MDPKRLGPYRIVATLGHGGMGAVYEAVNEETNERAAVKILSAAMCQQADFRHRFEAEIETLRKLRHPNIVRLFGFGEQDGLLFYAMELVDGCSLEEELQRGRIFTWREVAQIGIETCRALRHAHDRGVIHRDIKPANLLLSRDEHVKLSDFGIARLFGEPGLTAAGNVLGTVEFMAPEQADGRPLGPRTDLYSLGVVFFALLSGRPPFRGATPFKVLQKQRSAKPEPVRRYAPTVPEEFESIIDQLLQKDPQDRIANATLLQRRLEAMLHALSHLPDQTEANLGTTAVGGFDLPRTMPTPRPGSGADVSPTKPADKPADVPSTVEGPPSDAEVVPVTKATTAFQAYAEAESRPSEASGVSDTAAPVAPGPDQKSTGSFTAVGEDELDRVESEEPVQKALISPQTWALAVGLVAVGLTAWYLLRPLSHDALYQRIMSVAADRKISSLLQAEPDIEEFLLRFSNDPRCGLLRDFQRRLELHRLDIQFKIRVREKADTATLLPIERAYLEAIDVGRYHPEQALEQLEAILGLYGDRIDDPGPTGQCLQLVLRDRKRFQMRLEAWGADEPAVLGDRLDHATELSRSNSPEKKQRAREIRQAVITLYGDKPWAEAAVKRARKELAADDRTQ